MSSKKMFRRRARGTADDVLRDAGLVDRAVRPGVSDQTVPFRNESAAHRHAVCDPVITSAGGCHARAWVGVDLAKNVSTSFFSLSPVGGPIVLQRRILLGAGPEMIRRAAMSHVRLCLRRSASGPPWRQLGVTPRSQSRQRRSRVAPGTAPRRSAP